MTNQAVMRTPDVWERRSFMVATAAGIAVGKAVELDANGKVIVSSGTTKVIGLVDNMPDIRAATNTGTIAVDKMAQIALFGKCATGIAGGTIAAGSFVEFSAGKVVTSGASTYIALKAATAVDQAIDFLVKG